MAKKKKPVTYTVTDGELVLSLEVVEEGGYLVTALFHENVVTQADSLDEAFVMARDLIQVFADDRAGTPEPVRTPKKKSATPRTPARAAS